jgi:proteasome lid subunit RPN8/RPN11
MAFLHNALRISWLRWWWLVRELRRRGGGLRESGAFLLGHHRRGLGIVTAFVFYDDIDPNALSRGHVHLAGEALNKVWDRCAATELEVLADVHTHPGGSGQSESDQAYPMIAIKGHTALIVPDFARSMLNLRGVGVYRHLGARKWISLTSPRPGWWGIMF